MPSEKSIFAVANPEKTDYLYFVADGSGGHKFSQTRTQSCGTRLFTLVSQSKTENKMKKGKFIVVEGLEGAGKSTSLETIIKTLKTCWEFPDPVLTRELRWKRLSEKLRYLIKHETEEPVTDKAELLMLCCTYSISGENVIKPALTEGNG